MCDSGALASLQSTGAQGIESQEQVQHENAKEHAIQGPTGVLALLQIFGCNKKSGQQS